MQKTKWKGQCKNLRAFDNGAWSKGNEKKKVTDGGLGHLRVSPSCELVSHFP